jgi:hypothetical protein
MSKYYHPGKTEGAGTLYRVFDKVCEMMVPCKVRLGCIAECITYFFPSPYDCDGSGRERKRKRERML